MEPYRFILQEIAERAGLASVKQIAARPGLKAVYRVTVYHDDPYISDTIATLTYSIAADPLLEVVYRGRFGNRPLTRQLDPDDYASFTHTLAHLPFDKLQNQQHVSILGVNLCLVERGAGSFVKGVLFSPEQAEGSYALLLEAIRTYLPEALREID